MKEYLNKVILGDCVDIMEKLPNNSIDCIVTDPPYGYSFMNKDWDKVVVGVDIWKECFRILKSGAFAFIMSAPRQDVLSHMIVNLEKAGFQTGFTSIYWTYASGFPKASNIGKMVDKRLGKERKVLGTYKTGYSKSQKEAGYRPNEYELKITDNTPLTEQAKSLDDSYGGFQPKPAVEIILVVMKPITEKTYVDQAMKNKHGITWFDDCRIPTDEKIENHSRGAESAISKGIYGDSKKQETHQTEGQKLGRFPANLLVSDDVLDDGIHKSGYMNKDIESKKGNVYGQTQGRHCETIGDSGSYSRYFSLDAWFKENLKNLSPEVQKIFPFLIVPKASKGEKNEGCYLFPIKQESDGRKSGKPMGIEKKGVQPGKNFHPTCKPIKLMSYLITIGSRKEDIILDPFVGSGTTGIAAVSLGRQFICIEKEKEYYDIAKARIEYVSKQGELL